MQICSIRWNEWRTSRNSSLFYFIFFHFSWHKTHLRHLLHPTFYPLQHHRLAFLLLTHLCVCVCVHESNSTTLPLLPGLIIVLRRALPFSIWYPWQHILPWRAVCLRWSFSPTHSSLFPFPLHYSLRNSPVFFLPLAYISCIALAIPSMSLCCAPFTFLCTRWPFALWFVPTVHATQAPATCLKWKAFTHLPCGLLLLRFIEFPWTDPFISVRYCMFVFSCWAVLK